MEKIKENVKTAGKYIKSLVKWLVLSAMVGIVGGIIGSLFHIAIDYITRVRERNNWVLLLLPIGGLVIAFLYGLFKKKGNLDTNRVLESARGEKDVPFVLAPLIFISTVITHFLGGSAGREGAALQLGGSIGYNIGKVFKVNKDDIKIAVISGMSAVFSALFGTPVTAAIFALEVTDVGVMPNRAFLPSILASVCAYRVSLILGVSPVRFDSIQFGDFTISIAGKVVLLAVACAIVSIIFCLAMEYGKKIMAKLLPNTYLRAVVGGVVIVLLTVIVGTSDYNGAGMSVIANAMQGDANAEAFILKIIFTAITISCGFKGGEIVPAFFIGATFGCVAGALLGLSPAVGAAIGFVCLFCGAVNTPIASVMLAIEVFGASGLVYFAIACAVCYLMSGHFSLYKSQNIVQTKIIEKE